MLDVYALPKCTPEWCAATPGRPCQDGAMFALVLGCVADHVPLRDGVTMAHLIEHLPMIISADIESTARACQAIGYLTLVPTRRPGDPRRVVLTPAGTSRLGYYVRTYPTVLDWPTVMPRVFLANGNPDHEKEWRL